MWQWSPEIPKKQFGKCDGPGDSSPLNMESREVKLLWDSAGVCALEACVAPSPTFM